MIRVPYEQIIEKIKEGSKLSQDEIESRIKDKMRNLSGLISKEGAAHILANELNVKLFDNVSGRLQIKNILPGMRSVETVGRVMRVFEVRQFSTETRSGSVGSFMLGDETGSIRIVLWGDQTNNLKKMKEGSIVKVVNGYVRENTGRKEIHINDRSKIIIDPPNEHVNAAKEDTAVRRKSIKQLNENDRNVEILGTIVQVFEPKFFEVCPQCNKRARLKEESWVCDTHQKIKPSFSYVMNVFLDDGTENIRVVCFRNQAEQLLGKTADEILQMREFPERFEDDKNNLLGKMIKVSGNVRKNEMFNRFEFISQQVVTDVNPDDEIKRVDSELASTEQNFS
jgi:replication factor A1